MLPAVILSFFLSWVQVSTDTYVIKSSAGEEPAKRVLGQLEGFHQLVGSFVFRSTQLPELPIEVLLIGDEDTLKELAPTYQGRKIDVSGYYQRGQDRDFIVLSGRERARNLTGIAYHELTHYFVSRSLVNRPAWLSEGLAEYFSTADIRNDRIVLGGLSPERLQLLKTEPLLSLEQLFAVDSSSPYYNESRKANVFYAESWAFIYYMMHGDYTDAFKRYIEASTTSEVDLLDYLKVKPNELNSEFVNYLRLIGQRSSNTTVRINAQTPSMKVETIPDAQAQISMAEIFLASGEVAQARHYFEIAASSFEGELPRASYYRGVLARLAGDPAARDLFVDALPDPQLGARAAVQLVQLGELHIPTVRSLLEQAAGANTRMADVYLALVDIYTDEMDRIEEAVRLRRLANTPAIGVARTVPPAEPAVSWRSYANGREPNTAWELMTDSAGGPRLQTFIAPYYPPELLEQKSSGKVVMEVQVTDKGDVAGVWLVSAEPDVFGTLATSAVREWRFEPIPSKIRVVLNFAP
jgi:TonB family protein